MIGVGITTRNRNRVAAHTVEQWRKFMPEGTLLVVVDDASGVPFAGATFRFEENVGISRAKNKCLALLEHCEHIFLADDDCYPLNHWWASAYISSNLQHACYTFNRKLIDEQDPSFRIFDKPNGCMLFFTKLCLRIVGGWDEDFKGYGYEHVNISDRIFNAGLTPARYIDVPCQGLFALADCESSVSNYIRATTIPQNESLYKARFNQTYFKPYK